MSQWTAWFTCFWAVAYAAFLQWQLWRLRNPLIVVEPVEDQLHPDRINVEITVRNRGPWDVYVQSIALKTPALPMKRRDGGGYFLDDVDVAHYSGRELAWGARLPGTFIGTVSLR